MGQRIIGLLGLGTSGLALAQSLQARGFMTLCFDFTYTNRLCSANAGIATTSSFSGVVMHLPARKILCLALESQAEMEEAMTLLATLLNENDIVINAGDTSFALEKTHCKALITKGVHLIRGEIFNGFVQVNAMREDTPIKTEVFALCKFILG